MIKLKYILIGVLLLISLNFVRDTTGLSYGLTGSYLSTNGEKYEFNRFSGKPVLIDATATWCSPCKDQIANLKRVFIDHSDDIQILTLSVSPLSDTIEKMDDLRSETQTDWEYGVDASSEFMNKMKIISLPTIYMFDEFGYLLQKWEGLTSSQVIDKSIDEYLEFGKVISRNTGIDMSIWSIVSLALLFGILTAISPCLFPLFPSYIAISIKKKTGFLGSMSSSLLVILGILSILLAFSLIISYTLTSFLIQNYLYFALFQAITLILGGMILIKTPNIFYKIKLPHRIEEWVFSEGSNRNYFGISYVFGLIFTLIAAPCASGYFLSIMVLSLSRLFVEQLIILLSYSIGAGIPILVFNIFNVKMGSKSIGNIHLINKRLSLIAGLLIIGMGVWIWVKIIIPVM
ncbi:MAG: redoxin domain-containing protein [Candidatus Heimdallarchaeota archaeon]|nr:redoxin domain-containing protein [Candidatus Heimdallarchaeota archaeon]